MRICLSLLRRPQEILLKEFAAAHRAELTSVKMIPKSAFILLILGPCLNFLIKAEFLPLHI